MGAKESEAGGLMNETRRFDCLRETFLRYLMSTRSSPMFRSVCDRVDCSMLEPFKIGLDEPGNVSLSTSARVGAGLPIAPTVIGGFLILPDGEKHALHPQSDLVTVINR